MEVQCESLFSELLLAQAAGRQAYSWKLIQNQSYMTMLVLASKSKGEFHFGTRPALPHVKDVQLFFRAFDNLISVLKCGSQ